MKTTMKPNAIQQNLCIKQNCKVYKYTILRQNFTQLKKIFSRLKKNFPRLYGKERQFYYFCYIELSNDNDNIEI